MPAHAAPARPGPRLAGHTLVELAGALLLASVLLGMALPELRSLADRSAASGAREALVGLLAEARMAAVARGGATVELDAGAARAVLRAGGDSIAGVALRERFGVELRLAGGRPSSELRYDALGLGRLASETVAVRRGGSEARIVVSGYGRVRRP